MHPRHSHGTIRRMNRPTIRLAAWGSLIVCLVSSAARAQDAPSADRAAWMREAKLGVMTHYLADWIARRDAASPEQRKPMTVERWNELIDRFDVEALAGQIESAGAKYLIFT